MNGYDAWKTTPPEPEVVGKCAYCDVDLYPGCDYSHDRNSDEYFCDDLCYLNQKREEGDLVTEEIEVVQ